MKTHETSPSQQRPETDQDTWDSEGYTAAEMPEALNLHEAIADPEAWQTKGKFSFLGSAVRSLIQKMKHRRETRLERSVPEASYSMEAKEYWERGVVEEAADFESQVLSLKQPQHAYERSNMLSVTPESILNAEGNAGHSKTHFTEREGMLDLDSFFDQVFRATEGKTDSRSQELHEQVRIMEHNFTFLGKEEYDTACKGVAQMWYEYLRQPGDNTINIYNPHGESERGNKKSYNAVFESIAHHFNEITASDETIRQRLHTEPRDWQNTPHAKLIVVDDWVTSGATIRKNMSGAMDVARKLGMDSLAQKAEAHMLMLRSDQVGRSLEAGQEHFVLRGYYKAPSEHGPYTVSPSGAHSAVDYGFQIPLKNMHRYLVDNGVHREMPLLADVEPEYYDTAPRVWKGDILQEIGSLNKLYNELKNEETNLTAKVNRATDAQQAKTLYERLHAARGSLQAVLTRRSNLIDQYRNT